MHRDRSALVVAMALGMLSTTWPEQADAESFFFWCVKYHSSSGKYQFCNFAILHSIRPNGTAPVH